MECGGINAGIIEKNIMDDKREELDEPISHKSYMYVLLVTQSIQ